MSDGQSDAQESIASSQSDMVGAVSPEAVRIAKAMGEGLDGREGASDDALWMHMRYNQIKYANPHWEFSRCRDLAVAQFVQTILDQMVR